MIRHFRRTLQAEDLVERAKPRPKRNPPKPRFFERSRPKQLEQSDIFSFPPGRRAGCLIGDLDDSRRYVTRMVLYRSQSAEVVLEACRRAVAEYGVPQEMLTDNGRLRPG